MYPDTSEKKSEIGFAGVKRDETLRNRLGGFYERAVPAVEVAYFISTCSAKLDDQGETFLAFIYLKTATVNLY